MKYKARNGVYLKDKNNTINIIYTLLVSIIPFVILSTIYNEIYLSIKENNFYLAFRPLIFLIISCFINVFTEYLFYLIKHNKKNIIYFFDESFSIIPGVFLSIITPIDTPLYILILSNFIASIYKVLSGGFAKNKLNQIAIGYLVIFIYNYNNFNINIDTYQIIVNILSVLMSIYLIIKDQLKYRVSLYSIIIIILLSLFLDINLYNLLSGYVLFSLMLVATDNITTPVSHKNQRIGGIILGILVTLLIYITGVNETVFIAILLFNIITNYLIKIM